MTDFLNVYDLTRKKTAVLQNAYSIKETQELNKIYTLEFSLPSTDEKVKFLQPFHYVRYGDTGQLYRIISSKLDDSDTGSVTISCEHVIATLCDTLMFGAKQYGGDTIRTGQVITWLLNQQTTKNWQLDECDFDRRFEYLWEEENILNALYSIPREFSKAYKWTFNTSVYPWRVSLKAIDETVNPEFYIRAKRNMLSSGTAQDFADICTRIYPLGYGEGVNQLTIKDVNNGQPYLQSPASIVALYGIKEKVLVDRRFENAEALKEYAQTTLDALQVPSMSRSFDVVDLYPLTSQDIDNAEPGKICKMTGDNTIAYITKTVRVLDDPGNLTIDLSTKATDVASTIADLAERVRIESVYAQGATQLYQHSKDDNASATKGSVLNLYFPEEMRQINKVLLKVQLERFRSYSKTESAYYNVGTKYTEEDGSVKNFMTTGTDGSVKNFSTSGNDGGKTGFYTTGNDGGKTGFYTTGNDGGKENFATSGEDGGKEGLSTVEGGRVDTESNISGGGEGTTSVASGGGGISLGAVSVSVSVEVQDTENANWNTFVAGNNGTSNLSTSSIAVTGNVNQNGSHSHKVSCDTGDVTPPASDNYRHHHAINADGGAQSAGLHGHSFTSDYHDHNFSVYKLKHTHPVKASGSGSVTVNNTEEGETGFSHSHNFSIAGHTHTFSIPAHKHTFDLPNHKHTFDLPNHKHTFNLPNHTHKFDLPNHKHTFDTPDHKHKIEIGQHAHDITPGIFEASNSPKSFSIWVNGTRKTTINSTSWDGDITQWLLNADNKVPRNSWIKVEIRPNDLAYVVSSVFVQGFVQSRGDGTY